jgi:hypothetical protein
MKGKEMGLAFGTYGEKRNDYRGLVREPEGRRGVGRSRHGYRRLMLELIVNNVVRHHAVDSARWGTGSNGGLFGKQ